MVNAGQVFTKRTIKLNCPSWPADYNGHVHVHDVDVVLDSDVQGVITIPRVTHVVLKKLKA